MEQYAANFTGRQDTPWWCAGTRIRRGFLELYRSMSVDISLEVKAQLARYNKARVIVTVMNNDPVSTEGAYGFLHDRSDDPTSKGTPAANRSFAGKIFYGLTKKANKEIIFY